MRRIAIIDDDALFALGARREFEGAAYDVEWFGVHREGVAATLTRTFDLVLLSVEADGPGIETCRRLREEAARADVPIIAVTTNPELHSDALLSGADESFLKSSSLRELLARADAVLRRAGPATFEAAAYEDDDLKIFPDTMRVIRRGEQIFLSKGESDVLALLIRHAPASLPVERIREEVSMASRSVSRSTIEARLKGLRRKIGHDRIANRIGFGYSFQGSGLRGRGSDRRRP
ncbi:MAG TPA: response regulator transcription factor [Thermoanaerobaculia bacterium]|nr:response regulator transcription factor [Thermoanaerobaculia bacterium]